MDNIYRFKNLFSGVNAKIYRLVNFINRWMKSQLILNEFIIPIDDFYNEVIYEKDSITKHSDAGLHVSISDKMDYAISIELREHDFSDSHLLRPLSLTITPLLTKLFCVHSTNSKGIIISKMKFISI